jgi:hypothetical protein
MMKNERQKAFALRLTSECEGHIKDAESYAQWFDQQGTESGYREYPFTRMGLEIKYGRFQTFLAETRMTIVNRKFHGTHIKRLQAHLDILEAIVKRFDPEAIGALFALRQGQKENIANKTGTSEAVFGSNDSTKFRENEFIEFADFVVEENKLSMISPREVLSTYIALRDRLHAMWISEKPRPHTELARELDERLKLLRDAALKVIPNEVVTFESSGEQFFRGYTEEDRKKTFNFWKSYENVSADGDTKRIIDPNDPKEKI